jgi:hypothetical protein
MQAITDDRQVGEMKRQKSLMAARAFRGLQFFRKTTRVEEAFYLRFQRLPAHLLEAMRRFWAGADDWEILRKVCRYWGVSFTRPLPKRQTPSVEATVRCEHGRQELHVTT